MSQAPKILVVEDEETIRLAVEMMLEERDWQVLGVETGLEAVKAATETPFDVVILDKNLPDISGVEVLQRIRDVDTKVRAIMLTGYANVESAVEMATLGVDAFLEKPLQDIYELGDAVARSLQSKQRAADFESSRDKEVVVGNQALGFLVNCVLVTRGAVDSMEIETQLRGLDLNPSVFEGVEAAAAALERADLVFLACAEGIVSMTKEVRSSYPDCRLVVFQPDPTLTTTMALIGLNLSGIITEPLEEAGSLTRIQRIVERIVCEL
jgi:DNA-binding response OmpR family regulator